MVTDAKNLLSALACTQLKIPAEQNFIVHLQWLKNKLECGVIRKLIWCDTRDMSADGHTKGSIDRTLLLKLMGGHQNFNYDVKRYRPQRLAASKKVNAHICENSCENFCEKQCENSSRELCDATGGELSAKTIFYIAAK